MKKHLMFCGISATLILASGCGPTTTIYDPATTTHGLRQEGAVSSEEFRAVANDAAQAALSNAKFKSFMNKYKKEMNDVDAIPVVKLDRVINDTDDPDLKVDELTDMLNDALLNAGEIDITMAEGSGKSSAVAESRQLAADANFDQKTVAKAGTLQAARLLLRPKVISNTVKDGDKKATVRTFVLEMADVKTGLVMWKYTKQLGFIKEKGFFGW